MKVKQSINSVTNIEMEGQAHLCFPVDEKDWFQGDFITEDNCHFSIHGNKYVEGSENKAELNGVLSIGDPDHLPSSLDSTTVSDGELFQVSVHDHDQAIEFTLDQVLCKTDLQQCSLFSNCIEFQSDNAFKGQKAKMLVQNFIPKLVDKKLQVFKGLMKITMTQQHRPLIPSVPWSL